MPLGITPCITPKNQILYIEYDIFLLLLSQIYSYLPKIKNLNTTKTMI